MPVACLDVGITVIMRKCAFCLMWELKLMACI